MSGMTLNDLIIRITLCNYGGGSVE